ncbi:MAG: hypothetical protein ABI702_07905 [Burkholderiales bacterium]
MRVLVVDDLALHRLMAVVLMSTPGAAPRYAWTGANAVLLVGASRFDLILLKAGNSCVPAMVVAADIRQAERESLIHHRAHIVACTSVQASFDDCLVPGSGLTGAIKSPWTVDSMSGCLERWFPQRFWRGEVREVSGR